MKSQLNTRMPNCKNLSCEYPQLLVMRTRKILTVPVTMMSWRRRNIVRFYFDYFRLKMSLNSIIINVS